MNVGREVSALAFSTASRMPSTSSPVSTASSIQALEMLLLMFSTAFIPTTAVDGSLRDIVRHMPFSPVIEVIRAASPGAFPNHAGEEAALWLGVATVVGQLDIGFVYVDGSTVGEITDADLKDRRILGEEGFISVIVVVDSATGRIITGPEIHARGFAEDDEIFTQVKPKIVAALDEAARKGTTDTHQLQQVVRRAVGGWVGGKIRRRPMIIPVVVEA